MHFINRSKPEHQEGVDDILEAELDDTTEAEDIVGSDDVCTTIDGEAFVFISKDALELSPDAQ